MIACYSSAQYVPVNPNLLYYNFGTHTWYINGVPTSFLTYTPTNTPTPTFTPTLTSTPTLTPTFTPTPVDYLFSTSATAIPTQTNSYVLMSGNSVTLTTGTWELSGLIGAGNEIVSPQLQFITYVWSTVNGDNTATIPATVVTGGNITFKGGVVFPSFGSISRMYQTSATTTSDYQMVVPQIRLAVSANTQIFLDTSVGFAGSNTNCQLRTSIWAKRVSSLTN